ncbi:MAG TPA: 50S ribosomal protein L16 [Candidatus Dojkabacteria bacterium]|nr:50S ribosomal protein L16 [Candidatus Dojkabacteria bacterium]HQF36594.1 50S ribosomal protein L16 [Candidatus Dojkabacteria bacterium]
MLQPKKTQYTKIFTKVPRGVSSTCTDLAFGEYGLKTVENGFVTSNQIEAVRMALSKSIKRKGKVWVRIFPDLPVTKKPTSRMGGGKSPIDKWVTGVKKGKIMFEIGGITDKMAQEAFRVASKKLPVKIKMVSK